MMKRMGIGILVFGFVLAMGTAAQAAPELGVGTGTFACPSSGEYYDCFSGASGSGESFIIGPSGSNVIVWADKDDFGDDHDIWLIGDSSFAAATNLRFDGESFVSLGDVGTFGSYATPYVGVNLSYAGDTGWDGTNVPGFFPNNGGNDFYRYEGALTYDGAITPGNWLFAVAAAGAFPDGAPGGQDQFSPKTTSAYVPEPGTVMLLGSGLLGLVLYRRKFQS